jgi:hypothetical protein
LIGQNFDIDAQLVVAVNDIQFVVVAQEHYIIVNFKDLNSLERLLKLAEKLSKAHSPKKKGKPAQPKSNSGPLKKLQELNDQILDLGLVIDIRVNNKTYVEFGSRKTAKITAAAIFGKIGSFFSK